MERRTFLKIGAGTAGSVLVPVFGNAIAAEELLNPLAAGFKKQWSVGELGQRLHECRFLLRLLQHLSRGAVERERPEGLAVGDLEPHQRGAVLFLERLYPAAGVEHDGGQGIGLALLGGGESPLDDPVRLGQ